MINDNGHFNIGLKTSHQTFLQSKDCSNEYKNNLRG